MLTRLVTFEVGARHEVAPVVLDLDALLRDPERPAEVVALGRGVHDDAIRAADGAQAMGNQNRGGLRQNHVERPLNLHLGERVNAGGRLVENEDGGALHQNPQQADQLALPHAQTRAALAHFSMQPIGHGFQPFALTDAARLVVERVLDARLAFLVSGGTGSGKTTLLGALLSTLPPLRRFGGVLRGVYHYFGGRRAGDAL